MENKQTAVEWLMEEISYANRFGARFNSFDEMADISKYFDKAKQMEKEQTIEFAMHLHKVDMSKTGTDILMDEAEQYYNETYGK